MIKKQQTGRSNLEVDHSLGYVSASEIMSFFSMWIRQLDTEIWPKGATINRDQIIEFVSAMRPAMMARCGLNYEDYCRRTEPTMKKSGAEATANAEARKERMGKQY